VSDRLILQDVAVECRIGVSEEERRRPQPVWVDVELRIDAAKAAARDDVEDAVDYAQLAAAVKRTAQRAPSRLLETLAERIAAGILGEFKTRAVRVRVKKRALPGIDYAAVEVERRAGRRVRRPRRTGRFPTAARA